MAPIRITQQYTELGHKANSPINPRFTQQYVELGHKLNTPIAGRLTQQYVEIPVPVTQNLIGVGIKTAHLYGLGTISLASVSVAGTGIKTATLFGGGSVAIPANLACPPLAGPLGAQEPCTASLTSQPHGAQISECVIAIKDLCP